MNEEVQKRDWSYSNLARKMGVAPSNVSMVLNSKLKPTWEFCAAAATAFGIPPEIVFRHAGLLKRKSNKSASQDITDIAYNLSDKNLTLLKDMATLLYKTQEGDYKDGDS